MNRLRKAATIPTLVLVLFVAGLFAQPAQALNYPSSASLPMSVERQPGANTCWGAAAVAIMGTLGTYILTCNFINYVKNTTGCPDLPANAVEVHVGLKNWNFYSVYGGKLNYDQVRGELGLASRPVFAGRQQGSIGHAVALNGYDDMEGMRFVTFMDPKQSAPGFYSEQFSTFEPTWINSVYNIVKQ